MDFIDLAQRNDSLGKDTRCFCMSYMVEARYVVNDSGSRRCLKLSSGHDCGITDSEALTIPVFGCDPFFHFFLINQYNYS